MNLNGLERQPGFVGIASALVETAPEYERSSRICSGGRSSPRRSTAIRMARASRTASAS